MMTLLDVIFSCPSVCPSVRVWRRRPCRRRLASLDNKSFHSVMRNGW